MLFILRFTDRVDAQAIRQQQMAAHIAWLAERQDQIRVAGSLRHALGQNPVGALWVVEAQDKAEAEASYASDPFWLHGLRESVEVLHWSKAFPGQPAEI
ncbi:MAG: hypothetical protein HYZ65_01720 [Burkholderiales bacterium]|nr:hypothetical protein [Burkholderiales bacterium]